MPGAIGALENVVIDTLVRWQIIGPLCAFAGLRQLGKWWIGPNEPKVPLKNRT
jgi:hypothetical protein